MLHDRDNVRIIHDVLCGFSTDDRLTALMVSIVESDPRALDAVLNLIGAVGIMSRCLTPAQRLAICWSMLEEVQAIGAKWN